MTFRNSRSHPLEIARVGTPAGGDLGLTLCPGKHDPQAMSGAWARDLHLDLQAIREWPSAALVTLLEDHEFELLRVPDLGARAVAAGLDWFHLPIRDVSVPDAQFEETWRRAGSALRAHLEDGDNIVIHCRGGLGRTGLVACRVLVELGCDPVEALTAVRAARPGAVETNAQADYVLDCPWTHRAL